MRRKLRRHILKLVLVTMLRKFIPEILMLSRRQTKEIVKLYIHHIMRNLTSMVLSRLKPRKKNKKKKRRKGNKSQRISRMVITKRKAMEVR